MCGILWAIYKKEINEKYITLFQKNLKKMESRWPNYTKVYQDKNMFFWHTGLSSQTNQPFQKNDCIIIFSGKIYNFKELKNILEKKWYSFSTTSDTEMLIYAYQEWWEECVDKFDGMRAFALYDTKNQKIFLSRDRIWEKPLIYYHDNEIFAFWSEINVLRWIINKNISLNNEVLSNFDIYNFRHIPFPYTPFQNIFKLEPGYNIIFDIKDFNYTKYKYLKINKIKIQEKPIEQCNNLLVEAVQQTCFADVPIGIFLSGGVDSSLIAAIMKNKNITTYSLWYDENDEELKRAKKIAKYLWLKNKQIYFKEYFKKTNFLEILKKIIKHYWEPINLMQIIYSNIILKEMKKDGVVVAIWGNWADELFYGYDGMNMLAFISRIKELINPIGWNILFPNSQIKNILYKRNLSKKKYIKSEYRKFKYSHIFTEIAKEIPSKKLIDIFSRIGLRIENEHSITIVNDVAWSINSMELRTPFLNKNILDFACSLPIDYKIKSYREKKENKYILKKVLEKYLPTELVYFRKMGFWYNVKYEDLIFNEENKKNINHYIENIIPKISYYDKKRVKNIWERYSHWEKQLFWDVISIIITCIWYDECANSFS